MKYAIIYIITTVIVISSILSLDVVSAREWKKGYDLGYERGMSDGGRLQVIK